MVDKFRNLSSNLYPFFFELLAKLDKWPRWKSGVAGCILTSVVDVME